jgi:hypothetical protein
MTQEQIKKSKAKASAKYNKSAKGKLASTKSRQASQATITIKLTAKKELERIKKEQESFTDTILRLVQLADRVGLATSPNNN